MSTSVKISIATIDGFVLSALRTRARAPRGVCLWLHGITVDKDEYLGFFKDGADFLAQRGIDSLRFDFRGHGKSSGSSSDFNVIGQVLDLDAAIAWLKNTYRSRFPIHIVACSFGAPVAIVAAIKYASMIKSVTLVAPVLSYERTFLKPETPWARSVFSKAAFRTLAKTGKLFVTDKFYLSPRLIEEMRLIHPEALIANVASRLSLIHGERDTMVPYSVSHEVALKNRTIEFHSLRDTDHGYTSTGDEDGSTQGSKSNRDAIFAIISDSIRKGH